MDHINDRLAWLSNHDSLAFATLRRLAVCAGGFSRELAAALLTDSDAARDLDASLQTLRAAGFVVQLTTYVHPAVRYAVDPMLAEAVLAGLPEAERNTCFWILFDFIESDARRRRDDGQHGPDAADLMNAIAAFDWSVEHDPGAAFWFYSAYSDHLRQMGHSDLALDWIDRVAERIVDYHDTLTRGAVFNAQGVAHQNVEGDSPAFHLREAIAAYRQAVLHYPPERAPSSRAIALHNLGTAYSDLSRLESRAQNLHRALDTYREALAFRTIERVPTSYAATQLNVGQAYRDLASVETLHDAAHLRAALAAYDEALRVYTPERYPLDYAATQNNIGNAYRDLAGVEDDPSYLQRAIDAYRKALRYRTPQDVPHAYATTQNNLGTVYRSLADEAGNIHYLEVAVRAFEAALIYYAMDHRSPDFAAAHNNLGAAYHKLSTHENRDEYLARAIMAFRVALRIYLPETYPLPYATTQANLGLALRDQGDLDGAEQCWREAHRHFELVGDLAKAAMIWEWLLDLSSEATS